MTARSIRLTVKTRWLHISLLTGAIIIGVVNGRAQNANVSGTWKWTKPYRLRALAHLPPQNYETWFDLKQDGQTLTGTITGMGVEDQTLPVEGTIDGSTFVFRCTWGEDPNVTVVTFTGNLNGDKIEGIQTYQQVSVQTHHWTATRTERCHKEGNVTVDARSSDWNEALSIQQGQRAMLRVPKNGDQYQVWGIIDPQKRGPNTVTGNGQTASGSFAAAGFHEGALLVRYGNGQTTEFPISDGILVIYDPGSIAFIANDEGGNAAHLLHPGGLRNGYGDNYGSISIHYQIDGCPPKESSSHSSRAGAKRESEVASIDVASVSLTPPSISIGHAATLNIRLTGPAPAGGLTLAIDTNSDGAQDTLKTTPTSVTLSAGQNSAAVALQTQVASGAASRIIFTVHTAAGTRQSAQLTILH
jgi:hypothetical protein